MMEAQIAAVIIFVVMFVLIVLDKIERHITTLLCGAATLILVFGVFMQSGEAALETLNVGSIFTGGFWYAGAGGEASTSGINWETIIFIFGMMVMVEGMAKAGFFRWLCMMLAKMVKYKTMSLLMVFMLMSAGLAMFIDSITVILFLAAVTIELAKLLKFNPVPMILAEIFCANLGGSATMCGDPPNIIIGTSLGYSFSDFITNTGMIAGICLVVVIIYFFFLFRKDYGKIKVTKDDIANMPDPATAITSKRDFGISCGIFGAAVILLVTHADTGLSVAFIGVIIAVATILTSIKSTGYIMKRVDFKTLLFFVGLFIVIGGLEQTGILELIAGAIGALCGNDILLMVAIIIWVSAIASAFIDNIPFAATMIPVIKTLSMTQGVSLDTLSWTLALGTDIGGSATPIGASANVVGTSVAAKNGYLIGWGKYCKTAAPVTIIVVAISMVLVFLRYCI